MSHKLPIMSHKLPPLLTVSEAAIVMGVDRGVAARMDQRGELPTFGTATARIVTAHLLKELGIALELRGDNG